VFATGYNYDFPYLPKIAMYKSGHRVGLYKHVFPPKLEHPTLAINFTRSSRFFGGFFSSLFLPSSVLGWCCLPSPSSSLAHLTFLPSRWCISQPARHDQSSPDADWAIKVSNDRPLSVMGPAPVVKPCIKLCSSAQLACP